MDIKRKLIAGGALLATFMVGVAAGSGGAETAATPTPAATVTESAPPATPATVTATVTPPAKTVTEQGKATGECLAALDKADGLLETAGSIIGVMNDALTASVGRDSDAMQDAAARMRTLTEESEKRRSEYDDAAAACRSRT